MTPREGVSKVRVVCDLCDGTGTITIVDHYDDEGKSVYAPEECPECEGRLYVERTPYVDPAHPAATAREEAWKAMVEALTYIASHRGLTLLGDGSYSDGVRDGWIELADAADRALALARSTGGA